LFPSLPYRYLLYLGKNIGEGAAFTGMMRQLEAHLVLQSSLLLSRASVRNRVNLVAHLDGTKFEVQQRLQLLQKDLCQKFYQMKQ
jgi:DHA2 family multidrug resistance protein